MAVRLSKREREAKRAIIKSNLQQLGSLERTSGSLGSTIRDTKMLARTHVGFRDAHNAKPGHAQAQTFKRWGRD